MPRSPLKPCAVPGCPGLTRSGRYCPAHQDRARRPADRRPSPSVRGYGRAWQALRRRYLDAHPLCTDPDGVHRQAGEVVAALHVDHIRPRREGGTDDWSNLQGLCHRCHSRKTVREDGGWGRRLVR